MGDLHGPPSVRPVRDDVDSRGIMANEKDSDDEVAEVDEKLGGEVCERVGLPLEEEVVRKLRDPKMPSQEEVGWHYVMGHIPYRSWCPICVKARGREDPHVSKRGNRDKDGMARVSMDYAVIGNEEDGEEGRKLLVGRDKDT